MELAGETNVTPSGRQPRLLEASEFPELIPALTRRGYSIIGPTVRDGSVVLDRIVSASDLPAGYTDEQSPGHYRLKHAQDSTRFAYAVGPQSWKKYLHPPEVKLWSAERNNGTFRILNDVSHSGPYAFLGVRACDLAAIQAQDRVLTRDRYHDPIYAARREGLFIVAVQCTQSADTCFCASTGSGPSISCGFDLALTELCSLDGHRFIIRAGSRRGTKLLSELKTSPVSTEILQQETQALEAAARRQGRSVNQEGLKELLNKNFDDPRWESISARCMTCANCTMVCPTCFCTTVEDGNDLTLQHADRWRRWDSCFTLSFSYIHGGSVRASAKARYRQWLTHKFSAWIDQFGTPGCVGCGRCITWCPVGIDLTESIRTLQEGEPNGNP
jgi:sulfhydrogenase subunit beta (sulfur reductase)